MSTGDQADFIERIKAVLPQWFNTGGENPVLDGVLALYASSGTFNYSQIDYVRKQMRITTATDINLDAIAIDFFGVNGYLRGAGENDVSYRSRILATILQERATRHGMYTVLLTLTNRAPIIFEPQRAADSGGYSSGGAGYSTAGGWSHPDLAYQCFVEVFAPFIKIVSSVAGYNIPTGAYSTPSQASYLGPNNSTYIIVNDLIFDQINKTKVEGTLVWVRFSN